MDNVNRVFRNTNTKNIKYLFIPFLIIIGLLVCYRIIFTDMLFDNVEYKGLAVILIIGFIIFNIIRYNRLFITRVVNDSFVFKGYFSEFEIHCTKIKLIAKHKSEHANTIVKIVYETSMKDEHVYVICKNSLLGNKINPVTILKDFCISPSRRSMPKPKH